MYRALAASRWGSPGIGEQAIALRSLDAGSVLWLVVLGAGVLLVGGRIVGRGRTGSTATEASAPEPTPPEPAIMTDEERVVRLLESNGGRVRQGRIVEEFDWSKSKVSMLLSRMESDGTITKLRVGRENIIALPGAEPAAARSSPASDRGASGSPTVGSKRNG